MMCYNRKSADNHTYTSGRPINFFVVTDKTLNNHMGIKSAKAKKRHDKKQNAHRGPTPLIMKDEYQEYGKVTKVCGNCRFKVLLPDMREYLGVLCKRMFKRAWINVDQIVLVSRRDFQEDKVDIIHRYNDDDVRSLIQMKELPHGFMPSSQGDFDDDTDFILESNSTPTPTATATASSEHDPLHLIGLEPDDSINIDDI